jgi:hypothetical protein
MALSYHEFRTQSPYISPFPDDWGVRYRISGDLLLVYNTGRGRPELQTTRKKRGEITTFSHGTSNRMARYLRETEADYRYMHTLTYPSVYPTDGREVKYHLRRYCQELMRISKRNGKNPRSSIFWFIEFQNRGAPHFHILTTDFYSFKRCAMLWYAIVGSNDLKHLKAGTRVETIKKGKKGMITYARKYARKQEQKEVPENYQNVGRFYGVYGWKKCVAADTTFFNDSLLKPIVLEQNERIIESIKSLIESKNIRLLKQSYGFRMFHIEHLSDSYRLMNLIDEIDHLINQTTKLSDSYDLSDDDLEIPHLSEYELDWAKIRYLEAKGRNYAAI